MEAQQLYIEDVKEIKDEDLLQLVGFKLGEEEYAIDVLKIQEIIRLVEITSVPRTDSYILGVMNLRGKVIPVVDLRVRFNLEKSDFDKKTRIIVVRFEKENIGFVVDEVTQVVRINKSVIEPTPPLVGSIGQEYILGICKYDDRLIILLDIDMLVYENKGKESQLKKLFKSSESTPLPQTDTSTPTEETFTPPIKEETEALTHGSPEMTDALLTTENEPEPEPAPAGSPSDDIDSLIAMELAKREKETEEMIKKKKSQQESIEDILNDAIQQAEEKIDHNASHVFQEDLDALIAEELAKREKETEEMIKRKKEAEKKNESLTENVTLKAPEEVEATPQPVSEKSDSILLAVDSLDEIRKLAKKIINGEEKDISIDVKGELGEVIKLIHNIKEKVDNVEPTLELSHQNVPSVTKNLQYVNTAIEEAANNLILSCDELTGIYGSLNGMFKDMEKYIENSDKDKIIEKIAEIEEYVQKAEKIGMDILQALEFQDVTEQKIYKIIKNVEEIGIRLGSILGYVAVSKLSGEEDHLSSQEEINKLLSDFGLN